MGWFNSIVAQISVILSLILSGGTVTYTATIPAEIAENHSTTTVSGVLTPGVGVYVAPQPVELAEEPQKSTPDLSTPTQPISPVMINVQVQTEATTTNTKVMPETTLELIANRDARDGRTTFYIFVKKDGAEVADQFVTFKGQDYPTYNLGRVVPSDDAFHTGARIVYTPAPDETLTFTVKDTDLSVTYETPKSE